MVQITAISIKPNQWAKKVTNYNGHERVREINYQTISVPHALVLLTLSDSVKKLVKSKIKTGESSLGGSLIFRDGFTWRRIMRI